MNFTPTLTKLLDTFRTAEIPFEVARINHEDVALAYPNFQGATHLFVEVGDDRFSMTVEDFDGERLQHKIVNTVEAVLSIWDFEMENGI